MEDGTMKNIPLKGLTIAAVLMAMAGCASTVGTDAISDRSRTGVVHDVTFEEELSPAVLAVKVGDEVRWLNQRGTAVRLEFLEGALNGVVCQSGFSNILRQQQESATIRTNQSSSLCFGQVGTVTYNARTDSSVAGGQRIESGTIRVTE